MINKFFELERLKETLRSKGLEDNSINVIVSNAQAEIENAISKKMAEAMEQAIEAGVAKGSAEFINDLRPSPDAFRIDTASGSTDFSTPPFPMLPRLLQGAKPMKDGSGVYKVIPVGSRNKERPKISANIFDAQKAIAAERAESANRQYNTVTPKGSVSFRTATSKQSAQTSWVIPAKEKDFNEELTSINSDLERDLESIIMNVIREFEESF